jgi:integrase
VGIDTVKQRERLKCRPDPYFHKLATGQYLGFRKTPGSETWIARAYDPVTRRNLSHSLGDFGNLQPNERFNAASSAARAWLKHVDDGGSTEIVTVAQACERYAVHLGRESAAKAKEARRRFAQYVHNDPIANVPLPKLRKHHVADWRKRLADTPATFERSGKKGVGRGRGKGTQTRPRSPLTVDRDIACVRAALNLAHEDGLVTSTLAWRASLKSSKAHNQRTLYLDRAQCRSLLAAIDDEHMRAFVAALAVLPLRPGALAARRVADFDVKHGVLRIGTDKAGAGRFILLPAGAEEQLKQAARSKLPGATLFSSRFGRQFRPDEWVKAIKQAASKAKLPPETVAYTLRHSTITDLVVGGLDLLTVAKIAGTSVTMIDKHYGHLQQNRAREALATLAL